MVKFFLPFFEMVMFLLYFLLGVGDELGSFSLRLKLV